MAPDSRHHEPVHLADLQRRHILRRAPGNGSLTTLERFAELPEIAALGWPIDVVDQWLYEHLPNDEFLRDYAALDLARLRWSLEDLPTSVFEIMPTGEGGSDYLANEAPDHHPHWVRCRGDKVIRAWEERGSWVRPPIVIDRGCIGGRAGELQLVEGRTRVGVLRGRLRDGLHVAPQHAAWVGRWAGE